MKPILGFRKKFLDWFDGSYVVDENGEPLMVYHTTDKQFKRFNKAKLGLETLDNANKIGYAMTSLVGFWFSSNHFESEYTPNVVCAYLSIKNPVEYYNQHDLAEDLEIFAWDWGIQELDYSPKGKNLLKRCAANWVYQTKWAGNDGIIIENDTEYKGTSYVVFDSRQIRIAKHENFKDGSKHEIKRGYK